MAPSLSLTQLNITSSMPYKLKDFSSIKIKHHNLFPYLGFEWKARKAEILELNTWNTDTINNPKELARDSEHIELHQVATSMHKVIHLLRCKYGFQKLSSALISSHIHYKAWIILMESGRTLFQVLWWEQNFVSRYKFYFSI